MKQSFSYQQTLKQTLSINQKMIRSLDYLKVDNIKLQELISHALQQNPFLEYQTLSQDNDTLNYLENISGKPQLKEELYKQVCTLTKEYDETILHYLIESLDERGFLSDDMQTYIQDLTIDKQTFIKHLDIIQSFEPAGVAAKNSIDAVCLQLKRKRYMKAYSLMKNYQDVILSQNYSNISSTCHLDKKEIEEIFCQIRSCSPFPCSDYSTTENPYISADIVITVEDNQILITPIHQPNIMINASLYQAVKEYKNMKEYFQEAHFILENLTKRNQTIMMIANELVTIQESYFKYHDELKPCTLKDLSERCGFHESTISRTLHNKYYIFNSEIYPLKHLLVSKTTSGDSSDAIKKALVVLINNEDKKHPLSDVKIVKELENMDLFCSRRVITKYREQLRIPSSSSRRIKY